MEESQHSAPIGTQVVICDLGRQDYQTVLQKMRDFTDSRTQETPDEIWLVEHDPIFTQGQAGKAEHLLFQSTIPVCQSDRGGQITYHGPGQLVAYLLIDVRRKQFSVRAFVTCIEQAVIQTLLYYKIEGQTRSDAPGVYVLGRKICSLGLRIRKGCSYHGLALNVMMDLKPFLQINPCGYAGLEMTQLQDFVPDIKLASLKQQLIAELMRQLSYTTKYSLP